MNERSRERAADGDLVFIGDVHLDVGDPHLDDFLSFLDTLAHTARRIVFLGDLFNVWIGQPELEQPHQTAVLEKLAQLRERGIVVRYVEGNRDFRIAPAYVGSALDEATLAGVTEEVSLRRFWAIHGDLANPADWRYRTWRRVSRSGLFWGLFNLLPQNRRLRLAESLERGLRKSNRGFKQVFPEPAVRAYGESFLAAGADIVVLGHFHVERDLDVAVGAKLGRILVLPEWRESRRHLQVTRDGTAAFVDSRLG